MEAPTQTATQAIEPGPAAAPATYRLFSGPGAYMPVTPWSPWGGVAASIGAFLGAVLAVGAGMLVAFRLKFGADDVIVQIMVTLIQQVAMIALTLFAASRYGGKPAGVLALRPAAQGVPAYAVALLLLAGAAVLMTVFIRVVGIPVDKNDIKLFEGMFKSQWWWLAVILVGIGAPLSEELLCRGFLFSALAKSRIGIIGASVITSLIFAVVHPYSIVSVIQVFVIGMLFAWMLVRTGSLRVPIVCHSIFNTLQALALLHGVTPP